VKVGVTVLTLAPAGALVRLRVGAAAAAVADVLEEEPVELEEDAEEDVEEEEDAEAEEDAELDAALDEEDEALVEDEEGVAEELAEAELTGTELDTEGIAPASATWPRSGIPRSGNGERFFIKRFMFKLAWSRLRTS
jgi:hypothetical protein